MNQHSAMIWLSFAGAFAGALSMAENLADPRTYLKAFVFGLGATGLLRAKLPEPEDTHE
jgi:hypothetical protein